MGLPIISIILTEDTVKCLPDDILFHLAECSTEAVYPSIRKYLANTNADPAIRERIARAYGESLCIAEYLSSEETMRLVVKIADLEYSNVRAGESIDQLREWETAISSVLSNKYAVPYLKPISGKLLVNLRDDARDLLQREPSDELERFYSSLQKYGKYFRDPASAPYRGTSVKKIIRNREKYEIMLRGLRFLIQKRETGADFSSWRFL